MTKEKDACPKTVSKQNLGTGNRNFVLKVEKGHALQMRHVRGIYHAFV